MAFRQCPECAAEVSQTAAACPKCGHTFGLYRAICGLLALVALTLLAGGIFFLYWVYFPPPEWGPGPITFAPFGFIRPFGFTLVFAGILVSVMAFMAWKRFRRRM